ncbi:MBL fold metallo-hydrolase [Micromonospora sp. NPDC005254]|uniref:MBL fold metallo-hydrolase n=1 Tax=Micromonospora sp. NPDC005254 TaxID=3364229 RepID=UPI0036B0E65B
MAEHPQVTFIGTATTVLRIGGFTLLTDPNFLHRGQRAYLGKGLWSRRRTDPALRISQLPHLDAVVLSHLHGDHFDRVARRELDRELPIVTTPAAERKLRRWGFHAAEGLPTWSSRELHRDGTTLRLTSMPGKHGPGALDRLLPDVMGTMIDVERGGRREFRLSSAPRWRTSSTRPAAGAGSSRYAPSRAARPRRSPRPPERRIRRAGGIGSGPGTLIDLAD